MSFWANVRAAIYLALATKCYVLRGQAAYDLPAWDHARHRAVVQLHMLEGELRFAAEQELWR